MSSWRRKVLTFFPDLRSEAQRPTFAIYNAFFELLPRVRKAHEGGDEETLRRIYGFAAWCFDQKAKDMWNAAGVSFYEHLFDSHRRLWPEIVQWLSPKVANDCMSLWEWRLSAADLEEVQRLLATCRKPLCVEARRLFGPSDSRENVRSSGET